VNILLEKNIVVISVISGVILKLRLYNIVWYWLQTVYCLVLVSFSENRGISITSTLL